MFASPSVRQVRSRVFPSQNKNRHHGFGLLIKKILHLRCVFFFEWFLCQPVVLLYYCCYSYSYTHLLITTILLRCYFVKTSCHQVICIHHQGSWWKDAPRSFAPYVAVIASYGHTVVRSIHGHPRIFLRAKVKAFNEISTLIRIIESWESSIPNPKSWFSTAQINHWFFWSCLSLLVLKSASKICPSSPCLWVNLIILHQIGMYPALNSGSEDTSTKKVF